MRYAYSEKKKLRVHLWNSEIGKTFCQVENGSKRTLLFSEEMPVGRLLCNNCALLSFERHSLDREFKYRMQDL